MFNEGILQERIEKINMLINPCILCPHVCKVNRKIEKTGNCHAGYLPVIASWGPHFGEEPPLVGQDGSGTIFFSHCNLSCIFCQNFDISHQGSGRTQSFEDLANIMLDLQLQGCHNINFVTPTHVVHAVLNALPHAIKKGLNIPLVYNSGGYDSVDTLRLLEGIFDIYMPDLKYFNNQTAYALSGIRNYVDEAVPAIREMFRQTGDLTLDDHGIATRGLIIRHLILPDDLGDTSKVIDFVRDLSVNTYFNLMDQYRPAFHAYNDPRLGRRITGEELEQAVNHAKAVGLKRIIH
jgi:putative pyruvate formate lyase activating enzyme